MKYKLIANFHKMSHKMDKKININVYVIKMQLLFKLLSLSLTIFYY